MAKKQTARRGFDFSHLMNWGSGAKASAATAEEDEDDKKAEEDEDDKSASEDDEKPAENKKAKKVKAEDDEAAAEDDEDDKVEGDDDDKEASATAAERTRWATVMSSKVAAEGRVATACNLLSTTDMSARAIISTLATITVAAAPTRGAGLYAAMGGVKDPKLGAGVPPTKSAGPATTPEAMAAQIGAAAAKARGKAA